MNLVALNIDTIPLGQPLPFALRGAQGVLLAHKGYVIRNRAELEVLLARARQGAVPEQGRRHRAPVLRRKRKEWGRCIPRIQGKTRC